jgi:small subunit ribosomal protein S21
MPKIEIRKGEDLERALRKFKTKLRHEGIMDEMKKREFYEKPSQRRRKEKTRNN